MSDPLAFRAWHDGRAAGRAEVAVVLLGLIAELRDRAVYASSEPLAELADRAEQRLKGLSDE